MITKSFKKLFLKIRLDYIINHLSYTPILGISAFIGLMRMGIYARLLNVDDFGVISKIFLISSFFAVGGSFGFYLIAQRDLPGMYVKGHYKDGVLMLGKVGFITTLMALVFSLLPITTYRPLDINPFFFSLAIAHGWCQQIYLLAVTDIRCRLEMKRYSYELLIRTVLALAVATLVAYFGGGVFGIVLAEVIINVLLTFKLIKDLIKSTALSVPVFFKISTKGFNKEEWKVSFVLLAGTLAIFFSTSVDRWIAADQLIISEFGSYSFAWISVSIALSVQALLNAGLFPLIAHKRSAVSDQAALRMSAFVSIGLLVIGLAGAYLANVVARWGIPIWYPKYNLALPLLPILLAAAAFRVSNFWSSYLVIAHKHNEMLVTQIALIALLTLGTWLMKDRIDTSHLAYAFAWLNLLLAAGGYFFNAIVAYRASTTLRIN